MYTPICISMQGIVKRMYICASMYIEICIQSRPVLRYLKNELDIEISSRCWEFKKLIIRLWRNWLRIWLSFLIKKFLTIAWAVDDEGNLIWQNLKFFVFLFFLLCDAVLLHSFSLWCFLGTRFWFIMFAFRMCNCLKALGSVKLDFPHHNSGNDDSSYLHAHAGIYT